ncbi:MAG: polysaccharide deacetylase family protein [Bacteroidales bacterium]
MNLLTFDLEEYYLYGESNLEPKEQYLPNLDALLDQILELLEQHSLKATFFTLGAIAKEYPQVVKRIAALGHEIGCHSNTHRWLTSFTPTQFEEDTKRAISSIEEVIGKKVKGYRAPAFTITAQNLWAFEILHSQGIDYDCSIFPASRDFGGLPNFKADTPVIINYNGVEMRELPMGVEKVLGKRIAYSGGGYFRLLPYSTIQKLMESRSYNMTYFHLHDFNNKERRKLSLRYFKSYYGIKGALPKLQKLLTDFEFINVSEAVESIDWNRAPVMKL